MDITIICDGGSLGNGTENSIGYGSYVISANGSTGQPARLTFGEGITNNEAEYKALIDALEQIYGAFQAAGTNLKSINILVKTDSQLIIGQLSLGWRVKALNLRPLNDRAKALCSVFGSVKFEKISGDKMKEILGH